MEQRRNCCLILFLLVLITPSVAAHSQSNSLLDLRLEDGELIGSLRIRILDLVPVISFDSNSDGKLTWGEIRGRSSHLSEYVSTHLHITKKGSSCGLLQDELQLEKLNAGMFLYIPLATVCSAGAENSSAALSWTLSYSLLQHIDASHRGLLKVTNGDNILTHIFSTSSNELHFDSSNFPVTSPGDTVLNYFLQGIWHIWLGFDHLLFLIAIIIPLFYGRERYNREYSKGHRAVLINVGKTVTAFTVAHSITLLGAIIGGFSLHSALVESIIAITVVLSGINILWPIFRGFHWQIAFLFGLIHGFGFAGALQDLTLPVASFLTALLSFNIGVEIGQLVVVILIYPFLYAGGHKKTFQRFFIPLTASAIVLIGSAWVAERMMVLLA